MLNVFAFHNSRRRHEANAKRLKADTTNNHERTPEVRSTQPISSTNHARVNKRKADVVENHEQGSNSSSTQPSSTKKLAVDEVQETSIFKGESELASDVPESSASAAKKACASLNKGIP
jgi:hypothetical protein